LFALDILDFFEMLSFLDFDKLGFEHSHTYFSVLMLAAFYLTANNDA
jgi:hypothetical protein